MATFLRLRLKKVFKSGDVIVFQVSPSRKDEHAKELSIGFINAKTKQLASITRYFENKTVQNLKDKEKIRFIEIRSERIVGFITAIFTVIFWTVSALMIFNGILTVGIFYVTNKYFSNLISNLSTIGQEKINIRIICLV